MFLFAPALFLTCTLLHKQDAFKIEVLFDLSILLKIVNILE